MDKQERIGRVAETEEDKLLLARLYDRLTMGELRHVPAATSFLTPREQALLRRLLPEIPLVFFGGYPGAERAVACYLPDYLEEDWLQSSEGPIAAVRASFFQGDGLTHRDFLGALMGLGIKRETVGDLLLEEGSCDFLVLRELLPYVLDNFSSAGRGRVRTEEIPLEEISVPERSVRTIGGTVSSLRLDSIVGLGFSMARGKASSLIAAGKVSLNDLVCLKGDKTLEEGDRISARGFGKMKLARIGGRTRKDRILVVLERYQ